VIKAARLMNFAAINNRFSQGVHAVAYHWQSTESTDESRVLRSIVLMATIFAREEISPLIAVAAPLVIRVRKTQNWKKVSIENCREVDRRMTVNQRLSSSNWTFHPP
jgi:hypothetical protein